MMHRAIWEHDPLRSDPQEVRVHAVSRDVDTEQLTWSAGGAPHSRSGERDLHNQTMTITVISEVPA
jgi:hypothetical protein